MNDTLILSRSMKLPKLNCDIFFFFFGVHMCIFVSFTYFTYVYLMKNIVITHEKQFKTCVNMYIEKINFVELILYE